MVSGESSFREIYNDFRPRIQRYLARMVGENEAEDLTQEVFVKVNQSLKTFRGEAQMSTWIYQIATNAALDKLRSPYFRERKGKSFSVEAIEKIEADEDLLTEEETGSADQKVILQEMNGCIREIIDTLP